MTMSDPIGYVVIQSGTVDRHVRVEPLGEDEEIPLTANEEVVDVLPAGGSHD